MSTSTRHQFTLLLSVRPFQPLAIFSRLSPKDQPKYSYLTPTALNEINHNYKICSRIDMHPSPLTHPIPNRSPKPNFDLLISGSMHAKGLPFLQPLVLTAQDVFISEHGYTDIHTYTHTHTRKLIHTVEYFTHPWQIVCGVGRVGYKGVRGARPSPSQRSFSHCLPKTKFLVSGTGQLG